jgi:lipopolysaccharide transport system ATP-binding protein
MPKVAISLKSVSKVYRLYKKSWHRALDTFGFANGPLGKYLQYQDFPSLRNINLEIGAGERVGIIGRNGAGKTTLLKLITGNFSPTSGEVIINGRVQSLMDAGLGFHPDFSGRENIEASLIYNGLNTHESAKAIADILEFVELKEFIDQPIKSYSLGMATRLAFATATAIHPDILIVDEVLSAGDAYFSLKSAERIKKLTSVGTTLLLVSHSTEQIVQYCQKAIWLDQGQIVQSGQALEVVKAYEAYIRELDQERILKSNESKRKHAPKPDTPIQGEVQGLKTCRWKGLPGPKIHSVRVLNSEHKETVIFESGKPMLFELAISSEEAGTYSCKYHFYIYTLDGHRVAVHLSEEHRLDLSAGEIRKVYLRYKSVLLGNGDYVITAGIYKNLDMMNVETAEIYDLLDRSFQFKIFSKYKSDRSLFHHPASWELSEGQTLNDHSELTLG